MFFSCSVSVRGILVDLSVSLNSILLQGPKSISSNNETCLLIDFFCEFLLDVSAAGSTFKGKQIYPVYKSILSMISIPAPSISTSSSVDSSSPSNTRRGSVSDAVIAPLIFTMKRTAPQAGTLTRDFLFCFSYLASFHR
jgi:hypothetical protein